jgi:hypothetical protein
MRHYDLEEAFELAADLIGHPCPCEDCSRDGGRAKSAELSDLAFELSGAELEPYQGDGA